MPRKDRGPDRVHFESPMGWVLCNHARINSLVTTVIDEATCKLCLGRHGRPQYTQMAKKFLEMKVVNDETK